MAATLDDVVSALNTIEANTRKLSSGGPAPADDELKKVTDFAKKIGMAGIDISEELTSNGRRIAASIGTTLTEGIRLEYNARVAFASQLTKYGVNLAATVQQIQAVQKSAADAFMNIPEGFQVSAEATAEFATGVKKAFGGEFEVTAESLRSFGLLGLTSAEQLERFRQSTGRAGLSTSQYDKAILRNLPSLLIFGNRMAKSAVDLAQLGISLESYRSVQQGVVGNLEGTLDTVNQLNQLGANIDFGTFTAISELGNPEETFRYLQSVIPRGLLQTSTSFRVLTEQLAGVKVDDLLRGGMEPAVKSLEAQFLEVAGPEGALAKFTAALNTATEALKARTGGVVTPGLLGGTGAAAGGFIASQIMKQVASGAGKIAMGAAIGAGTLTGAIALPLIGMGANALINWIMADDAISSGYGNRTLLTPKGSIAFNNDDTIIAGTNLGRGGNGDSSMLMRKVDTLIETLTSAKTVVNVDGTYQTVPRIGLVGVHTRYGKSGA